MSSFPERTRLESEMKRLISHTIRVINLTEELFVNGEGRERARDEIENLTFVIEEIRKDVTMLILMAIARTQPLGRELITLHSMISAVYDTYRISRYCRELARIDALLSPRSGLSQIREMEAAFRKAKEAVIAALEDLERGRPSNWDVVARIDAEIDSKYAELMREIASSDVVRGEQALELLAMRHIERIVDHAVYIEMHAKDIAEA